MRISIAFLLVCLCVINNAYGTLENVFGSWPGEIANAFTSAWKSLKSAVAKPVRIKRLGAGGRRKTTPPSNLTTAIINSTTTIRSTIITTMNTTPVNITPMKIAPMIIIPVTTTAPNTTSTPKASTDTVKVQNSTPHTPTRRSVKLMLPVLLTPTWRNLEDWKKLQKPLIGFTSIGESPTLMNSSTLAPETYNGTHIDKEVIAKDDEYFGVLMFV